MYYLHHEIVNIWIQGNQTFLSVFVEPPCHPEVITIFETHRVVWTLRSGTTMYTDWLSSHKETFLHLRSKLPTSRHISCILQSPICFYCSCHICALHRGISFSLVLSLISPQLSSVLLSLPCLLNTPSLPFLPPSLSWRPTGKYSHWSYLEREPPPFLSFSPSFSHFLTRPEQKAPLSENGSQSGQKFLFSSERSEIKSTMVM